MVATVPKVVIALGLTPLSIRKSATGDRTRRKTDLRAESTMKWV
jgi:hypothetical protein